MSHRVKFLIRSPGSTAKRLRTVRLTCVMPESSISIDYNNAFVFKGIQVHAINGRKIFDTWYRVRNFLSSGRLDISPVVTDILPLEDFEAGFRGMMAWPRESMKVVLFPHRDEYEAAKKRREEAVGA